MQKASKNEVRKEIADLINRIKEQSDRIGTQREIPQSELDLILHRIEELHRKTVVWCFLNELPVEVPGFQLPVSEEKVSGSEKKEPVEPPVINKLVISPQTEELKQPEIKQPEPLQPATRNPEPATTGNGKQETGNLKDVRSFVGFNEKLMYIRQVFGGDNAAYDAALDQINGMKSWTEAETFLGLLRGEYKWGKDSEPVVIFTHTVKQRFI